MNVKYFSGFADEAGVALESQIQATKILGWSNIEMRNVEVPGYLAGNLHDISDSAFTVVETRLKECGIRVNSLGSALANGGKDIRKPFDLDRQAALRAAERARRLKTEFIRIMSYPIGDPSDLLEEERFRRLREIVTIFADSGATVVHENCSNYGGMGWSYTLKLLENVPGLKLVFDMGNCASDIDYTQSPPYPRQNAMEFYQRVKEHIVYIHIKDALYEEVSGHKKHVFPGEGICQVPEILKCLKQDGYQGALSIEPHMGAGLDRSDLIASDNCFQTYIEYGRRLAHLVSET